MTPCFISFQQFNFSTIQLSSLLAMTSCFISFQQFNFSTIQLFLFSVNLFYSHFPPHTLHAIPPFFHASSAVTFTQYLVHFFTYLHVTQWYLSVRKLNETVSAGFCEYSGVIKRGRSRKIVNAVFFRYVIRTSFSKRIPVYLHQFNFSTIQLFNSLRSSQ